MQITSIFDVISVWNTLYSNICFNGSIDVGTNNQKLLNDPGYLGLKEPRLDGEEYYELIDEFMAAIKVGWRQNSVDIDNVASPLSLRDTLLDTYFPQNLSCFSNDFPFSLKTPIFQLRWPRALIQHEDFTSKHAVNLLKR